MLNVPRCAFPRAAYIDYLFGRHIRDSRGEGGGPPIARCCRETKTTKRLLRFGCFELSELLSKVAKHPLRNVVILGIIVGPHHGIGGFGNVGS